MCAGKRFAALDRAVFDALRDRALDLALRADADDLQELADAQIECLFVHGAVSGVMGCVRHSSRQLAVLTRRHAAHAGVALDRDADLAHARQRAEFRDAQLHRLRAELVEHERRHRFGEPLEQRVRMLAGERAQARHDRRVVDRVGELAGFERPRRRQADVEIDADRLRQLPLPRVDADLRLEAQVVDEDRVHVVASKLSRYARLAARWRADGHGCRALESRPSYRIGSRADRARHAGADRRRLSDRLGLVRRRRQPRVRVARSARLRLGQSRRDERAAHRQPARRRC